ncbi:conserved hypothetical protein [Methanoregula boonei 6A8]|jgi:hypothetical protein|uniref:CARDB domain-containing protein n=1 Tax=Methanoregula boonei (strain DSM 21154 / JCM 14090 / 6A8) TaxID=456442 RepID=A7I733_METB6|nr:CARDB domain-containing protein [Methanoregula boonei]ABS55544.1 conserved hypothetical protein [Methanoregula boonei 6A8]
MIQTIHPRATPDNGKLSPTERPAGQMQERVRQKKFPGSVSGIFLLLAVTLGIFAIPVSAYPTPYSLSADSSVYVSNVTYYPGAFFSGDSGTVTYQVINGNTNTSMVVNHASFSDTDIRLTSGTYDSSQNIGPLQTEPFTFSITTNASDGNYYPTFSLSFQDGESMHYQGLVKVDNRPLVMTIQDQPDAYTQGKKNTISVQIANPRSDDVHNVIFTVSGDGATLTPSQTYIGDLPSGAMTLVNFTVTPNAPTTLNLVVGYDNGDNAHSIDSTLPIQFTTDKQQADPVMSNIVITANGTVYTVNGDSTNAGLLNANGVTITALSPAVPEDPYQNYVIGTLKPDDFGSFELTFSVPEGTKSIPLKQSFKDSDGNVITSTQDIDLTTAQQASQSNAGPGMLPVLVVVAIVVIGAGGYLYMKKNRKQ